LSSSLLGSTATSLGCSYHVITSSTSAVAKQQQQQRRRRRRYSGVTHVQYVPPRVSQLSSSVQNAHTVSTLTLTSSNHSSPIHPSLPHAPSTKSATFAPHVVQLWSKLPEEVVSASSASAFISRLNSMHVSFLMFCFSAVCFFPFTYLFWTVVSAL